MAEPLNVLFVCVENACRSQIAEGFARHYGGGRVAAHSAGSKPRGQVDATGIAVMRERQIDISKQQSKGFDALPAVTWDAVVTMGCGDACPTIPARRRIDWQIPDPARQPLDTCRAIRDQIDSSVRQLLEALGVAA